MANTEVDEAVALDKKAAKRAARMKKKEEKKAKKQNRGELPGTGEEQEEETSGGKAVIALVTLVIVIIWLGILALLIKLDVGGFGSTILYPVLKNVPYVNKILPEAAVEDEVVDVQYPYATLEEAIARIKELEVELSDAQKAAGSDSDTIAKMQAEIDRLKEFEKEQAAFQEEKTKFYNEVVFSDKAPDIGEYKAYYESIDAANAAELYKQVVEQVAYDEELNTYAKTYASMKPKQAAGIMEQMKDDLTLVARILAYMDVESRGNILGVMAPDIAAKVTKLMEPTKP